jgi:cytochrome c oxidase subunit 1
MTAVTTSTETPVNVRVQRARLSDVVTSTDHKTIGYLYLATSFAYFCFAGVLALIMRAQLFAPGLHLVDSKEQYNQLFTMHGTIMMLLFATPLFAGFANAIMPLQIGAPDVAFPRLNALSF